jgi:O-methyltransferase involved in polyketide biosynthesis
MMPTLTQNLDSVPFTMLMTLAARVAAPEIAPDADFHDPWGAMVLKKLPWDLTPYQNDLCFVRHVALRARLMDVLTAGFFRRNPGSAGAGLGCGLCTRSRRIVNSNKDGIAFEWVDIDLPEVIEIRKQFLPPLPGEHLVACPVTDISWMDAVFRPKAPPLFLVMEGVSPYLTVDQNRSLFHALGNRLEGSGTEMIVDYIHPALVDSVFVSNKAGGTSTPFCSGFCDANDV